MDTLFESYHLDGGGRGAYRESRDAKQVTIVLIHPSTGEIIVLWFVCAVRSGYPRPERDVPISGCLLHQCRGAFK